MNDIKVKLTEKADKQMSAYLDNHKKMIIDKIIKNKRYPGDEEIEITASDIIEISKNIKYLSKLDDTKRVLRLRILSTVYLVIGLILFLGGIFYDEIMYLFHNSPDTIAIMSLGIFMFIVGLAFNMTTTTIEKKTYSNNNNDSFKTNI